MKINKLYEIDCRIGLNQMIQEKQQVDCVIMSPPYWSLRDYGIEPSIWDGDPNCNHNWNSSNEIIRINKSDWKTGNKISPEEKLHSYEKRKDNFCSKCNAWKGTLGLEPNFELYIKHLCDIYDLIWKVLKDTGTCWVNMGDAYSGGAMMGMQQRIDSEKKLDTKLTKLKRPIKRDWGVPAKCLLMLPQRFAIEMINRGWILRNVIIWYKPNAMPSSAKDRFTVDFEYIYFFVKKRKYYFEQQFDEFSQNPSTQERYKYGWNRVSFKNTGEKSKPSQPFSKYMPPPNKPYSRKSLKGGTQKINNPRSNFRDIPMLGKNKRTVWNIEENEYEIEIKTENEPIKIKLPISYIRELLSLPKNISETWKIPTQPNPEAHFATFPIKLVEPMIKSGCPEFVCSKCGKPREKIIEKEYKSNPNYNISERGQKADDKTINIIRFGDGIKDIKVKGYLDCGHNSLKPGIVLDPFAGTGTTLKVAYNLGRNFIGFEISKQYCAIFEKWNKNRSSRLDKFLFND